LTEGFENKPEKAEKKANKPFLPKFFARKKKSGGKSDFSRSSRFAYPITIFCIILVL
jgi:hypothetical protein